MSYTTHTCRRAACLLAPARIYARIYSAARRYLCICSTKRECVYIYIREKNRGERERQRSERGSDGLKAAFHQTSLHLVYTPILRLCSSPRFDSLSLSLIFSLSARASSAPLFFPLFWLLFLLLFNIHAVCIYMQVNVCTCMCVYVYVYIYTWS